jgi:hypothetical protein
VGDRPIVSRRTRLGNGYLMTTDERTNDEQKLELAVTNLGRFSQRGFTAQLVLDRLIAVGDDLAAQAAS